jgi:murein DD-endopeptidase MepM/ murein hydrolase activator NlpD
MRKTLRLSKLSLLLLDLILILAAVSLKSLPVRSMAASDAGAASPGEGEEITLPENQAAEIAIPLPTAVLAINSVSSSMPVEAVIENQVLANQPLKITFPTPGPAPVSALRPALYPTPWALRPYDHFFFSRPIAADKINWPLADYRYGGVFFEDIVHSGVDIPAPMRTPVLAAGSGKVTWAGYGLYNGYYDTSDPYGLAVMIRHDFGYEGEKLYTVYAHLDRIDVVKGQNVENGEVIGLSGQTGKVTGPHLHFEVRLAKDEFFSTRNPELWLVPAQGWGVLAGRVMNRVGVPLESHLVSVESAESGQVWKAYSYARGMIKNDAYYRENVVISDLPAGRYTVVVNYWGKDIIQEMEIKPGLVSFFSFYGQEGFSLDPPSLPGADFVPPKP